MEMPQSIAAVWHDANFLFPLVLKKKSFVLSVLEQLRSNHLFIAGDIKYILPLLAQGEMNPM